MTPAKKVLASALLALAALMLALHSGTWPPEARADTPADSQVVIVDLPVSGGAQVFTNSLALKNPTTHPNVAYRLTVTVKWASSTGRMTGVLTTNATGSIGTEMETWWPEHFKEGGDLADQCRYSFMWTADRATTNRTTNANLYENLIFEEDCLIQRLSIQEVRVP